MVATKISYSRKFQKTLREECPFDPNGPVPKQVICGMAWLLKVSERTKKDYPVISATDLISVLRSAVDEAKNF